MTSSAPGTALRRALAVSATVALGASLSPVPAYAAFEGSAVEGSAVEGSAAEGTTAAAAGGESTTPAVPSPASPAGDPAPGGSEEDLAKAVLHDLGMALEQFNAAGEQGKRAAAALTTLRKVAGFESVRLDGAKILVTGTGPALDTAVDKLNEAGPGAREEFVLAPSADLAAPATAPAAAVEEQPAGRAAAAEAGTDLHAASVEQLYRAYLREVGPVGLQAVAEVAGKFIIRTGGVNEPQSGSQPPASGGPAQVGTALVDPAGGGRLSPSEFVGQYANVVLESGEPLAPEEDFFGGQGYRIDGDVVCSAGFGAFSAEGAPLVLTAGHCADDGAAQLAEVTLPAGEPAGGFLAEYAVTGKLGTFGFSQFGGPGNSWVADAENPGTPGNDVAVIESIRPDLDPLPAATTWADGTSPGTGSVKIVGMSSPFVGQAVCRSGRTVGWSCGTVDEVGIYVVGGGSGDPADLRSFSGFLSTSVESSGGDSGGPWISGNYAVGTHSAGNASDSPENFAVAATLQDSMSILPGVQLRVFLNKPVLSGPLPAGPIAAGQRIAGRLASAPATDVPAGTRVRVTFSGSKPFDVDADAQGNWDFSAPGAADGFTAQAVNGFSRSGSVTFSAAPDSAGPDPDGSGAPGSNGPPAVSAPAAPHGGEPAVAEPAPQPAVVAALPTAGPDVAAGPDLAVSPDGAARPDGDAPAVALADTGVSGLTLAAAGAGAALLLGGLLLVLVRRRRKR